MWLPTKVPPWLWYSVALYWKTSNGLYPEYALQAVDRDGAFAASRTALYLWGAMQGDLI